MLSRRRLVPLALVGVALGLGLGLAGCAQSGDAAIDRGSPAEQSPTPPTVTATEASTSTSDVSRLTGFADSVLPIVERTCARCHTGDGPGTPHLRLDRVADLVDNVALIAGAVDSGFMPPWPASPESVAFENDWSLTPDERATLVAWATGRALVDIDESTPIVAEAGVRRLEDHDIEVAGEGTYDGEAFQDDEYRCFVFDPGFEARTWIEAFEFVPDQTEVVHHAIGYLLPAAARDRATQMTAQYPDQGGWPCFGASGLGSDEIFLGWAPGQGPSEFPDGSGLAMEAGDFVVMQIHYHFEIDAPPDRSTLRMALADDTESLAEVETVAFAAPAEIPCSSDESGPLCDRAAALERAVAAYGEEGVQADRLLAVCGATVEDFAHMTDGVATTSCDLPARRSGRIVGVLGHEHEIGASFRMTLRPDTPEEVVLLDIPDWDFDWQLGYRPVDEIEISAFDVVRIECSWDRSRRDPDLEPAYVLWADGTDDEMCFGTITVLES